MFILHGTSAFYCPQRRAGHIFYLSPSSLANNGRKVAAAVVQFFCRAKTRAFGKNNICIQRKMDSQSYKNDNLINYQIYKSLLKF